MAGMAQRGRHREILRARTGRADDHLGALGQGVDDFGDMGMGVNWMKAVGLPQIHGAGGTGGFADNVYTRMSYVDAPVAGRLVDGSREGASGGGLWALLD